MCTLILYTKIQSYYWERGEGGRGEERERGRVRERGERETRKLHIYIFNEYNKCYEYNKYEYNKWYNKCNIYIIYIIVCNNCMYVYIIVCIII